MGTGRIRGTSGGRPTPDQRGVQAGAAGISTRHTPPHGVAVTITRSIAVSPRPLRMSMGYLYIKPTFRGSVEVQFGSSNPRIEAIRTPGHTDIEFNNQISDAIVRRTTVQIDDQQLRLLQELGQSILRGRPNAGAAARLMLGRIITRTYIIQNWEIEPIMPPDVSLNATRAMVSVAFVRVTGEWNRTTFETTIFDVPARVTLTGEVEFAGGLKGGGWTWLARFLGRYFGSAGAAVEMQILSTQLAVRGLVNGLLGAATPAIVVTGTAVVTFTIDYLWSRYITYLREEGERRGLVNQFASGFIRRVFYPRRQQMWFFGHPTGHRRTMRLRGIQLAEAYLNNTPAEVLQQVIYHELDYNQRHEAEVSDLIFRFGEELYHGQRSTSAPIRSTQ